MTKLNTSTAPITDPLAFTPSTTQGFGTISGNFLTYRQTGALMHISGRFTTGTSEGTEARLGLPSGFTIGTQLGSGVGLVTGSWWRNDNRASERKRGTLIWASGNTYINFATDDYTSTISPGVSQVGSLLVGTGQIVWIDVYVPISSWSSNIVTGERALEEFSSNSSTTDAVDTSSFVYGPAGSPTPGTLTAFRSKRIRFLTPIQTTDSIFIEVQLAGGAWRALDGVDPGTGITSFQIQGSRNYGIGLSTNVISSTDIDVGFGIFFYASALVYGDPGHNWALLANARWRVRKISGGAAVGYPISGKNIIPEEVVQPPLTTSTSVPFGVGVRLVNSGTPTTQTLQAITAADDGKRIVIKNLNNGTVTIATTGGALIDGASTQALNQFECFNLMAYNSNWFII